ncbi:discoidin domain-containing protein [Aquabacterium sp.]|uniref:discoidin domain-containing protein n=1 Tax=Aquabacterium sp. TaxID=1872578 RepID=UPI003783E5D3
MRCWILKYAAMAAAMAAAAAPGTRLLDGFEDLLPWAASASEQVSARIEPAAGPQGRALCLHYDFNGVSGYAVARRRLALPLPARYAFTLQVRGEGASNQFQLKLVDASGDNVWWYQRPDFTPPAAWQPLKIRQRQIEFAWGPAADKTLRQAAAIELVVASGQGGGRGQVCVDALALHTLPDAEAPLPAPRLSASSSLQAKPGAALALDGDADTAWRSDARRPQWLQLDFGRPREFGGLVLHWAEGAQATRYDVQLSDDGRRWQTVRRVVDGQRRVQPLLLTDAEARFVRLTLQQGAGPQYALAEVEVKDLAWGASRNALLQAEAREAPRGHYPRGFRGEQPYWTVVGVDGGAAHSALLSEDGAVELQPGGFSVEPFLVDADGVQTWADAVVSQSLAEGYLPMPGVQWRLRRATLDITALALGTRERSQLLMRYRVGNPSETRQRLTLALVLRPWQVNPPTQFLNRPGGDAPVHRLAMPGPTLEVEGQPRLWPLQPPSDAIGSAFDAGAIVERLAAPRATQPLELQDAFGMASAALRYELDLAPGESREIAWLAPLSGPFDGPPPEARADNAWSERQQQALAEAWRQRLNRVTLQLPAAARPLHDTLRSALAQILVSREGPALQPGTRSYARSWVRDGAMMAEGLLRLGETGAAREFVQWFAPHQFASGKVPCCVDRRGADPVAEHDSHGELVFAIAELYRYGGDLGLLRMLWPHVDAAVRHLDTLRASERGPAHQGGPQRVNYGLLPASISHEGYSAKPMHAYWDDFWALRGYKDAVMLAQALGDEPAARRIAASRDEFRHDLLASIEASAAQHGIGFIPGAAELGDFDATSTTIALAPGGEQATLPQGLLLGTFERYWQGFVERRGGAKPWSDYTPYELRNVGALLRLGWPERAHEALAFFMADRRPAAWNQWAEVVGREAREPRFIGDMPHAWISSDFIRAVLDLLAYERESDQSLVIAAGVPAGWLDEGVAVQGLATPHGLLSYRLKKAAGEVQLDVADSGLRLPPGGLVLPWPGEGALPPATLDGRPAVWQGRELRIRHLPAVLRLHLP